MPPQLLTALIVSLGVVLAIFIGYTVADFDEAWLQNGMLLVGGIGVCFVPWYLPIGVAIAIATFNTPMLLPMMPGRPYLWEAAVMMCWPGLLVSLALGRVRASWWNFVRENRLLFGAALAYAGVLALIMFKRGVGFRLAGSEDVMGGRFYFEQIVCLFFPLACAALRPSARMLRNCIVLQCVLSLTAVVSEFTYAFLPHSLWGILYFFEVPGDAFFYTMQRAEGVFSRFSSLGTVAEGCLFLLFLRFRLREFWGPMGLFLIPLSLALFGVGLLSGRRILFTEFVPLLLVLGYSQRFFTPARLLVLLVAGLGLVAAVYRLAPDLPESAQRAVSFLPGIRITFASRDDAQSTLEIRQKLRAAGLRMAPQYFVVGRGFSMPRNASEIQVFPGEDQGLQMHLAWGRFYNGPIGLLVNTGIPGLLAVTFFVTGCLRLAWKNLRLLRAVPRPDGFDLAAGLVTARFCANLFNFLFVHGDSEFAMRDFSIYAGLLLLVFWHLRARHEERAADAAEPLLQETPS